jgi:hypothetical protein
MFASFTAASSARSSAFLSQKKVLNNKAQFHRKSVGSSKGTIRASSSSDEIDMLEKMLELAKKRKENESKAASESNASSSGSSSGGYAGTCFLGTFLD